MLHQQALQVKEAVPLSSLSTFGIGGLADYYCEVTSVNELQAALDLCRDRALPFLIIGKGSNCLFDDRGFRGLLIRMKIEGMSTDGNGYYEVGAGYSFAQLGRITAEAGFHGLEFASGIPATVGGAIFMNAGASGQETCNHLIFVDTLSEAGIKKRYLKDELEFCYRSSPFQKMKGIVIVSAGFQLHRSQTAKNDQRAIVEYRLKTQPYKDKSAGCIFRNPAQGVSSGKLIEESGLKGAQSGGAEVSRMHANFIVNRNGATSEEVQKLIHAVQKRVYEHSGYVLESEIRIIDQFGNPVQMRAIE